jgi:hypothetical protein
VKRFSKSYHPDKQIPNFLEVEWIFDRGNNLKLVINTSLSQKKTSK